MRKILNRLDEFASIETGNNFAKQLERIAFVFLILMVLSAPHSIAATQIAWLAGMLFWAIRLFVKPRPKLVRTPLDLALWSFFIWSVISAIFSYAPDISIDKLRNVALFLIFYFVINNLRNARAVKFLAFALIFSCFVSAAWSPIERGVGRGIQITGLNTESILSKANLTEEDAILKANGKNIKNPDDLSAEIGTNESTDLEAFRPPIYFTVKVRRDNLPAGADSLEKLGIGGWTRSRNWRYGGFYGHIITYAEVLQLIASLVLGLLIAGLGRREVEETRRQGDKETRRQGDLSVKEKYTRLFSKSPLLLFSSSPLLAVCLAAMIFALLTTFTRSAQIAFLISAFSIALANGNRKILFGLTAVILPVALAGFFFMQQSRKVGYYDKNDDSISYRQTVYREGFDLWTSSPRNFFLGVGMDSVKRYKQEWHLFDNGRLETSHFHSTPLQLLVERGLPALLLWLWVLWIYARTLLKVQSSKFKVQSSEDENLKFKIQNSKSEDWQIRGVFLGCFGGLIGFIASSLVNYSLGDGEVAMVFFLLMGLSISLVIQTSKSDLTNR
jgi:O-antigen ligase